MHCSCLEVIQCGSDVMNDTARDGNCTAAGRMDTAAYFNLTPEAEFDAQRKLYEDARFYCDRILIPAVLFAGIIGNTVTMALLHRRRLQHSCSKTGRRVTAGLICLAASDMAFCVIGFLSVFMAPHSNVIISTGSTWDSITLYYHNYKGPVLNTFLLTSTWLVISIAVARYDAIAEPFQLRDVKRDRLIKLLIFLLAVSFNIPQFFQYKTMKHQCDNGNICYFRLPGPMYRLLWYHILWHAVGTILPLLILVYCNCRLLCEIYKSLRGSPHHHHSTSKTAVILVSIISLFLILVCPSMILTLLAEIVIEQDSPLYPFRIATTITNLLQSVNFAVNFVLYTAVSRTFRRSLLKALHCKTTNPETSRSRRHRRQYEMQLL
jgi:hypothetical protein